ncbi:MAG: extracellular solute-binding protein [Candidatus Viridilinea halotolerans]|uniref:Extracellular solute-binding protein n=1 Tax=Candidatus Viridilinea halotolerans TaxID=2491704 RepID=A0A426UAY8_9CHLR|nr:MAG: extracellular solute-binding protein [Candidatus Viridilinea halotolerans]
MKRYVSLFTLVALVALMLAACGGETPAPATQATTAPTTAADAPADGTPATDATAETPAQAEPTEPAEPVTITIWHNWQGEYYNTIEAVLTEYGEANNVQVELLRVADLNDKVMTAVPSGEGPDIIAWVNDQIGKNVLAMIIQPVNRYGIDEAYLRENFAPVAVDAMIYEAQTWGVPESLEALTFIYNKALISEDELPQNTDELIARAREYNTAEQYLFVYNGRSEAYFSAPWWQGAGVSLVNPNGTTGLNSPEGIAAGELIAEFSTIMPQEMDYSIADTLFKEGKAAIIMNGPWAIADYLEAGLDVGLATIPVVSSSGQPGMPFVGVKMLMLANNARQPEAAIALMQHYGTAEVQARLAEANKQVPANIEAQAQVADDPIIAAFIAQTVNGKPMPNNEFIDAMWDPINQTVEAIWTGAATPDAAIEAGEALFNEKAQDLR